MCKKCDQRRAEGQKFPTGSLVLCGPPEDRRKAVVVGWHKESGTYGLVAWNKFMSRDDGLPVANAIDVGEDMELLDETDEALIEEARKYCREGVTFWEAWKKTPEGEIYTKLQEVFGEGGMIATLTPRGLEEDPRDKAIAFLQRVDRQFILDPATRDFEKALEEVFDNILNPGGKKKEE